MEGRGDPLVKASCGLKISCFGVIISNGYFIGTKTFVDDVNQVRGNFKFLGDGNDEGPINTIKSL